MIEETNFIPDLPRLQLAALPTALERCERLEEAVRADGARAVPRIYLKRDDTLSLALGGNKIRNLEFSIGAALAAGATDVITMGRAQSNHCRLTAAACARAGLACHVIMSGARPERTTGNLLLTELFGAEVEFTGSDDRDARGVMADRMVAMLRAQGRHPHVVPVGGSDPRGAVGHALLALEIARQCEEAGVSPDVFALATATGGTQAGLLVGAAKLGLATSIKGFTVNAPADEASATVLGLAGAVAREIQGPPVSAQSVHVDGSGLGVGYGVPSAAGQSAVTLLARSEGVLMDPVYTGKALGALLAQVRDGQFAGQTVVFIHTGGAPALFADLPATSL